MCLGFAESMCLGFAESMCLGDTESMCLGYTESMSSIRRMEAPVLMVSGVHWLVKKGIVVMQYLRKSCQLVLVTIGALYASSVFADGTDAGMPAAIPPGRSIHQVSGDVRVNGVAATLATPINPGDVVETFEKSFVIFVVEKDAFIPRSNSKMTLPSRQPAAPSAITTAYVLDRGKALSVLASRRTNIATPTAQIGVRGTGVYIESEPDRSYVCICYGVSDLSTPDDPGLSETIVSEHHTAPRYILADKSASQRIVPAPFKNHDDQELLLIETLVGRSTPYVVPKGVSRT